MYDVSPMLSSKPLMRATLTQGPLEANSRSMPRPQLSSFQSPLAFICTARPLRTTSQPPSDCACARLEENDEASAAARQTIHVAYCMPKKEQDTCQQSETRACGRLLE